VFDAALATGREERGAVIARECGGDGALEREVRALLARHDADGGGEESALNGGDVDDGGGLIGARVGGYTVRRLIGEGGMSRVYEAEQASPRRMVALKVLRGGAMDREAARRFAAESEILARLRHPSIARVLESGECVAGGERCVFMAMELVEGGEAITSYAASRELSVRDRVELMVRACEAVAAAHEHVVVHRDLKPGNVLVDRSGDVKVIDFGVARTAVAFSGDGGGERTVIGERVGTPRYMSPEQFAGDPARVGTRADVYGLGCVLWELLAGEPAVDLGGAATMAEARAVVERGIRGDLGLLNPGVDGALGGVVLWALEPRVERRYGSASALALDLERWLAGAAPLGPSGMGGVAGVGGGGAGPVVWVLGVACVLLAALAVGALAWGLGVAAERDRLAAVPGSGVAAGVSSAVGNEEASAVGDFFARAMTVSRSPVPVAPGTPIHEVLGRELEWARVNGDLPALAEARLLESVAGMYGEAGDYAESARLLGDALTVLRDEGAGESRLAGVRMALAYASLDAGSYAAALGHLDALIGRARGGGADVSRGVLASLLIARGRALREAGAPSEQWLASLREAESIARSMEAEDPVGASQIRAEVAAVSGLGGE